MSCRRMLIKRHVIMIVLCARLCVWRCEWGGFGGDGDGRGGVVVVVVNCSDSA